jgi:hypothetical protein
MKAMLWSTKEPETLSWKCARERKLLAKTRVGEARCLPAIVMHGDGVCEMAGVLASSLAAGKI